MQLRRRPWLKHPAKRNWKSTKPKHTTVDAVQNLQQTASQLSYTENKKLSYFEHFKQFSDRNLVTWASNKDCLDAKADCQRTSRCQNTAKSEYWGCSNASYEK